MAIERIADDQVAVDADIHRTARFLRAEHVGLRVQDDDVLIVARVSEYGNTGGCFEGIERVDADSYNMSRRPRSSSAHAARTFGNV